MRVGTKSTDCTPSRQLARGRKSWREQEALIRVALEQRARDEPTIFHTGETRVMKLLAP
jgi:hypothetical protein